MNLDHFHGINTVLMKYLGKGGVENIIIKLWYEPKDKTLVDERITKFYPTNLTFYESMAIPLNYCEPGQEVRFIIPRQKDGIGSEIKIFGSFVDIKSKKKVKFDRKIYVVDPPIVIAVPDPFSN